MLWSLLVQLALGSSPCARGYERLNDDACLAAPPGFKDSRRLILYFHGMLPPNDAPEVEFVNLGTEAVRRGYAVLAMTGEQGLCDWSNDVADWRCWPSAKRQTRAMTRILNQRVARALTLLSERWSVALAPPLVMGFSNGGFFTALLATDSRMPFAALAIFHAGNVTGQQFVPQRAASALLVAARDDAVQLPGMKSLNEMMEAAGWQVSFRLRDGQHWLSPEDARTAIDYFDTIVPKI